MPLPPRLSAKWGGIWIPRRARARNSGPKSRFRGKITSCAAIPRPKMTEWRLFDSWDLAGGDESARKAHKGQKTPRIASQDTQWGIKNASWDIALIPKIQKRVNSSSWDKAHAVSQDEESDRSASRAHHNAYALAHTLLRPRSVTLGRKSIQLKPQQGNQPLTAPPVVIDGLTADRCRRRDHRSRRTDAAGRPTGPFSRARQPLTAPAITPDTMYFWQIR